MRTIPNTVSGLMVVVFAAVVLSSCSDQNAVAKKMLDENSTTPEGFVRAYYDTASDSRLAPYAATLLFRQDHRAEILASLEIKKTLSSSDAAVVLIEYKVGDVQCKTSHWLRLVGARWGFSGYVSEYEMEKNEWLADKQAWAKDTLKAVEEWNDSKPMGCWWE